MKRTLALFLVVVMLLTCGSASLSVMAADSDTAVPTAVNAAADDGQEVSVNTGNSYYYYLLRHADAPLVTDRVIDLDLSKAKTTLGEWQQYEQEQALVIQQEGTAEISFTVAKSGFYQLNTRYAAVKGKPTNMEMCLYIDGEVPYTESTAVSFARIWKDVYEEDENGNYPKQDDNGNQLTPDSEEVIRYTDYTVHDNDYMTDADLLFYLDKGKHTLKLESTREGIAFSKLWFGFTADAPTYEEYIAQYSDAPIYDGETIQVHAELAHEKSEQNFTMTADYTNASTTPSDPARVRLNTIGGEAWNEPGQWISWKISVPEDGKYALSFKYRQDYVSGFRVYRSVAIDGEIPCQELSEIWFDPCSSWENKTVSDDEGNPYYVYLTEGEHILTLGTTLGPVANSLQVLSNSVSDLNTIYRKIIAITGASPDSNRDYDIDRKIPELMDNFQKVRDDLDATLAEIVAYNGGQEGGLSSFINVMIKQLDKFLEDPLEIPDALSGFKSNISSLSDTMTDMKSQAMLLDEVYVGGDPKDLPKADTGFFQSIAFSVKAFFLSFVSDYDTVGNDYSDTDAVYEIDEPVEVWMTATAMGINSSGRDQMNILKTIIDDKFVTQHNIPVNLSLVDGGDNLTKAVLAGTGPDCALSLGNAIPVTYTMRGALENMEQFNAENQYDENGKKKYTYTFDEVKEWFYPSAFICLEYLDGLTYGLPETQTFKMMFVRDDLLQELGLEVPTTWEELYACITVLQRNNMQIGIPTADMSMFTTLLLQNDNPMFTEDYAAMNLGTVPAIEAFEQWTEFNTKYSLPLTFDALNRFRSGEMPIILQPYTFYNNLEVGAPEIKGLWSMHTIPGTMGEDGSINSSQTSDGTSVVMIGGCDNKEAVWEFLSWWVGEETQAEFGQKVEARLGAGGRYSTANKAAFDQIPWSVKEQKSIKSAWESVSDIPKVPGDYYVTRMINNAFRAVVYKGTNPRESLMNYSKQINKELERKRDEYNIDRYFTNKEN